MAGPSLPAVSFLGLKGATAWAALAVGAGAAYYGVTRALPALVGGGPAGGTGGATSRPAAAEQERLGQLLSSLLKAGVDAGGRAGIAALGPGRDIAMAGVGLARDVTEAFERFSERQLGVIETTNRELVRSNTRQAEATIGLVERVVTAPPPRRAEGPTLGPFVPEPPLPVVTVTPAPPTATLIGPVVDPSPTPTRVAEHMGLVRPGETVIVPAGQTVLTPSGPVQAETVTVHRGSGFFESLPTSDPRSPNFDVKAWEAAGRPT